MPRKAKVAEKQENKIPKVNLNVEGKSMDEILGCKSETMAGFCADLMKEDGMTPRKICERIFNNDDFSLEAKVFTLYSMGGYVEHRKLPP